MKIFIDTANLDEIRQAHDLGILDGVTTNPSLVAKEKTDFKTRLKEICQIVKGPVSAEVVSVKSEEMIREAGELIKIGSAPRIYVLGGYQVPAQTVTNESEIGTPGAFSGAQGAFGTSRAPARPDHLPPTN